MDNILHHVICVDFLGSRLNSLATNRREVDFVHPQQHKSLTNPQHYFPMVMMQALSYTLSHFPMTYPNPPHSNYFDPSIRFLEGGDRGAERLG